MHKETAAQRYVRWTLELEAERHTRAVKLAARAAAFPRAEQPSA